MPTRLLRYEDLRPLGIEYTKIHLWRLEREGKFPKRVKLTPHRVAWVESEIQELIQSRIAARDRKAKLELDEPTP